MGGRENSGDSSKVTYFDITEDPLDLAEFKMGSNMRFPRCLHKGIITTNFIILIGGSDLKHIEVLTKKERTPQINAQNEFFENFYKKISKVNFNEFCLKKCSIA